MKKINWVTNRIWETIYINLRKEEIRKLDFNHQGATTIKITKQGYIFNFPSKPRPDLLDEI